MNVNQRVIRVMRTKQKPSRPNEQPDTQSGTYLEEQAEAHPLVVSVRLAVVRFAAGVVHAGVRHRDAHLLLERLLDGVRGVYPTVGVQHVLGYVLGVHAVDRVADVLSRGDDQAERGQQHHSQAVVQPEHGRVDVHVADFYQALQAPEHVKHGVPGRRDTPSVSPASHPQSAAGLSAAAAARHAALGHHGRDGSCLLGGQAFAGGSRGRCACDVRHNARQPLLLLSLLLLPLLLLPLL